MKEVKISKEEVFILSFFVDEELIGRVQLEKETDISLIRDACNEFLAKEAKSDVDKPELRPAFRPEPYEKPKQKVKLKISQKKLDWIQGELCAFCEDDIKTCDGSCNLYLYVKGVK